MAVRGQNSRPFDGHDRRRQGAGDSGLFCPGVAGMARAGDPDSANSQFFLMRQRSNEALEHNYTRLGPGCFGLAWTSSALKIAVGEPAT